MRLGDSRERAYDLVGLPTEKFQNGQRLSVREWFPASGLAIEFDQFGKARHLNFTGAFLKEGWTQSDRRVVFGLSSRSTREDFVRTLGEAAFETPDVLGTGESRMLTWRRGPYSVTGEFWVVDFKDRGRVYPKGTLRSFEVSSAQ